jgi:hypothetical protein
MSDTLQFLGFLKGRSSVDRAAAASVGANRYETVQRCESCNGIQRGAIDVRN